MDCVLDNLARTELGNASTRCCGCHKRSLLLVEEELLLATLLVHNVTCSESTENTKRLQYKEGEKRVRRKRKGVRKENLKRKRLSREFVGGVPCAQRTKPGDHEAVV